jgi:hypothetical protein
MVASESFLHHWLYQKGRASGRLIEPQSKSGNILLLPFNLIQIPEPSILYQLNYPGYISRSRQIGYYDWWKDRFLSNYCVFFTLIKTVFWRLDFISVSGKTPTQFGPVDRASPYLQRWGWWYVQKQNNCINIPWIKTVSNGAARPSITAFIERNADCWGRTCLTSCSIRQIIASLVHWSVGHL